METMDHVLNQYRDGDLHTRLNLFCHFRYLRDRFQDIDRYRQVRGFDHTRQNPSLNEKPRLFFLNQIISLNIKEMFKWSSKQR